jgi:hypothetical protein
MSQEANHEASTHVDRTSVHALYTGTARNLREGHGLTAFDGEFHTGVMSSAPIVDLLRRPQCKQFYNRPEIQSTIMADDLQADLLRPIQEVANATKISLIAPSFQRMLTYEDIAVPIDWHEYFHIKDWCMPFAVRTAQRPVKVNTLVSDSGKKLVMASVWKCGSTTLDQMFNNSRNKREFVDQHSADAKFCNHQQHFEYHFRTCYRHTSFVDDAAGADVYAASARNPLERFVSGVYEWMEFHLCNGEPCQADLEAAKALARNLSSDFPHKFRSCPHPTQAYFLSATDIQGRPLDWKFVMRLEDFSSGIQTLRNLTGLDLPAIGQQIHKKADDFTKRKYFDAIFSDLMTLCTVCKVYAQDFECLGYERPGNCTKDNCLTVGIDLAY